MTEGRDCRYVTLSLPAEKDMMLIVRLALSGVLARCGVTLDCMDDFKTAIEEASSLLLAQVDPCGRLDVRFDFCETCVQCTLCCDCPAGRKIDAGHLEVARSILDALVTDAQMELDEDMLRRIVLAIRLPR